VILPLNLHANNISIVLAPLIPHRASATEHVILVPFIERAFFSSLAAMPGKKISDF
jgi:hypothetical protein